MKFRGCGPCDPNDPDDADCVPGVDDVARGPIQLNFNRLFNWIFNRLRTTAFEPENLVEKSVELPLN